MTGLLLVWATVTVTALPALEVTSGNTVGFMAAPGFAVVRAATAVLLALLGGPEDG